MELFHAGAENKLEPSLVRARNEILVISGFDENSAEHRVRKIAKRNANL